MKLNTNHVFQTVFRNETQNQSISVYCIFQESLQASQLIGGIRKAKHIRLLEAGCARDSSALCTADIKAGSHRHTPQITHSVVLQSAPRDAPQHFTQATNIHSAPRRRDYRRRRQTSRYKNTPLSISLSKWHGVLSHVKQFKYAHIGEPKQQQQR